MKIFILESIIQYLLSLLVDKELRYISADAILIICLKCRKQLVNDLEQIIQATLWLDQMETGSEAAQCLLKASAKLISRLSSSDDIHRYLNLLFDQQIRSLTEVCENLIFDMISICLIRFFQLNPIRIVVRL
jgi:hypothetical protein